MNSMRFYEWLLLFFNSEDNILMNKWGFCIESNSGENKVGKILEELRERFKAIDEQHNIQNVTSESKESFVSFVSIFSVNFFIT